MDDLISRQAEIDAIVEFTHMDWESLKILYPMLEVIDNLPSAEPKKGKWIISKVNGQYQCSNCGMFTGLTAEDVESGFYLMKYCGNCGADMRKSE